MTRSASRWTWWRKRNDPDVGWREDAALLPHRASRGVVHVVELVEDDRRDIRQPRRSVLLEQHVAEDFGGHHQNLRVAADRHVAREQAHPFAPELPLEVAELLVGERLERRGVDDDTPPAEREVAGQLTHDGLARAGRAAHDDVLPAVQR
eukprot:CAMPEP_0195632606 /NCGR_PEP_ID=MMETSP0815-20121206/21690_1 /TAXON_ID=97485 /ORGANISM="Prymnesium parvum, Strain Texoma1" /LENGTH=149 /DNA_ID=CAMNT_0040774189 /DNA_START=110 /DNA_END=556 /DNA_ORIENTATION=-